MRNPRACSVCGQHHAALVQAFLCGGCLKGDAGAHESHRPQEQRLTARQKGILDLIGLRISRDGYAPTLDEIADGLGLSSLATVHAHLVHLQKLGLIKRTGRARDLEIVVPDRVLLCFGCLQRAFNEHRSFDPDFAAEAERLAGAR